MVDHHAKSVTLKKRPVLDLVIYRFKPLVGHRGHQLLWSQPDRSAIALNFQSKVDLISIKFPTLRESFGHFMAKCRSIFFGQKSVKSGHHRDPNG